MAPLRNPGGAFAFVLQTCAEEKRVRMRQVWLSTVSGRSQRTPLYVRSWPKRAPMQVAYYDASVSVSADVGLQCDGYYYPAYS